MLVAIGICRTPDKSLGYIPCKYYGKRFNLNKAYMSQRCLGLQIMIIFLGTYMWINVLPEWLTENEK